jgi:hypothetical protein
MVSSGKLCRVALVRTDVSKELSASFIRVTRIGELGTTLAVTSKHMFTDGGKVKITRPPHYTPRNISDDQFCWKHECI